MLGPSEALVELCAFAVKMTIVWKGLGKDLVCRSPDEIVHLLLDIPLGRSGALILFGLGLPSDISQHADQRVNVLFAVFDA